MRISGVNLNPYANQNIKTSSQKTAKTPFTGFLCKNSPGLKFVDGLGQTFVLEDLLKVFKECGVEFEQAWRNINKQPVKSANENWSFVDIKILGHGDTPEAIEKSKTASENYVNFILRKNHLSDYFEYVQDESVI